MHFIDTHSHIYLPEFDTDRDESVARAVSAGAIAILMPNIDMDSTALMMGVAARFPGLCLPMMGLHPTSVNAGYLEQLSGIEKILEKNKFIAIGEIGVDLYWDKTFINEQLTAFRRQLSLAHELKLPVAIHSRESFTEVFNVLDEFRGAGLKGVMHAFSGNIDEARKAIDAGYVLGIGGVLTFKNSQLPLVVKDAGLANIIIETDSPFLAPVPHRGKRNESHFLTLVIDKLAEIFGLPAGKVAEITLENTRKLFDL